MGLIKWFRREKIRRGARKEIKHARETAPGTRQGQRALARKIEKIRARTNKEIDKHRFSFGKNGKVPPFAYKAKGEEQPPK